MTPAELLRLLQELYRETLELFLTREINAQSVAAYDANNAYQQMLGRQEVHLQWLADAIAEIAGTVPESPGHVLRVKPSPEHGQSIIEGDARAQTTFLERWTPRVAAITNARHRKLLELILGEMKEHLRMFQQALEGRSDLLGRHSDGKVLRGKVLSARPKN